MLKRLIIGLIFLGLFCLVFIFFFDKETVIEKDYFAKAGISSFFYNDIISNKGIPLSENIYFDGNTRKENGKVVIYPGYRLFFVKPNIIENKSDYILGNVKITDKNYQIARQKISIGTSKLIVDKVYQNNKKLLDVDNGFVDGDTWIQFKFDKQHNVSEIMIYYGP